MPVLNQDPIFNVLFRGPLGLFVFHEYRREMIVSFVDIDGIVCKKCISFVQNNMLFPFAGYYVNWFDTAITSSVASTPVLT